jgi:hypothetical protein
MIDYSIILSTNYVGKQWALNGDSYDGLTWLDSSPKPTQSELDALWESTQSEVLAKEQATKDAKTAALAKLTALGLTTADLTALGL